jgi:hypothetical protein
MLKKEVQISVCLLKKKQFIWANYMKREAILPFQEKFDFFHIQEK